MEPFRSAVDKTTIGLAKVGPGQRNSKFPLTLRVKPCVIQRFVNFDSMDRTLKCKVVEQYITVVLFVILPSLQFRKCFNFGLDTRELKH